MEEGGHRDPEQGHQDHAQDEGYDRREYCDADRSEPPDLEDGTIEGEPRDECEQDGEGSRSVADHRAQEEVDRDDDDHIDDRPSQRRQHRLSKLRLTLGDHPGGYVDRQGDDDPDDDKRDQEDDQVDEGCHMGEKCVRGFNTSLPHVGLQR
jgi:hypothetical protein